MRDVIIVGAGGGGGVAAKELAARGLDVLLLEAGPDNAYPRRRWSHYENDAQNPATGFLRWGPEDRDRPPWLRHQPQTSYVWQIPGVGGTTLHYFGNSPRAMPGEFAGFDGPPSQVCDPRFRFPFPYEELVPYYEWVEATLPVMTAPMGTKEQTFYRGCEAVGLPLLEGKDIDRDSYRPQQNAVLQPGGWAGRTTDPSKLVYPEATGCTMCGYQFEGCMQPIGAPRNRAARRSTDNSYVPMALTADAWAPGGRAVTLQANAFVERLHTERRDGELVATGVTFRDTETGDLHREDARVVVLAGGCVETPRLWLQSGLPDPNGWVGRGLTDHFIDDVFGMFDDDVGSTRGANSQARADFPGEGSIENIGLTPAQMAFALSFSASGIRRVYDRGRGYTGPWEGRTGRFVGTELKEMLGHGVDRFLHMLVLTGDDVSRRNRVRLSGLMPPDEHGRVPRVEVPYQRRSRATVARREKLARRAARILEGAGATAVFRVDWAPIVLHVQSTMRMGDDPATSVLEPGGEARAVKRLFITDNSALSNGLGGPNPTLTTQALATRTCEHVFQRYFGGEPWVRRESPVESTDQRVSDALPGRFGDGTTGRPGDAVMAAG